jgi:hypothetical protein
MKAAGVIRIETVQGYPNPGIILAEQEDGKSFGDFMAVPFKGGFLYEIPYTADNIQVAKGFWRVRGFKVSIEFFIQENPFTTAECEAWEKEDKVNQLNEQKKVKALELEREKILKSLPGLDSTFQEEFNKHMAKRAEADDKRLPQPEKPASFDASKEALDKARNRIEQITSEVASLKSGIYL